MDRRFVSKRIVSGGAGVLLMSLAVGGCADAPAQTIAKAVPSSTTSAAPTTTIATTPIAATPSTVVTASTTTQVTVVIEATTSAPTSPPPIEPGIDPQVTLPASAETLPMTVATMVIVPDAAPITAATPPGPEGCIGYWIVPYAATHVPGFSADTLAFQQGLIAKGYNPGPADGLWSITTEQATIEWATNHDTGMEAVMSGVQFFWVDEGVISDSGLADLGLVYCFEPVFDPADLPT